MRASSCEFVCFIIAVEIAVRRAPEEGDEDSFVVGQHEVVDDRVLYVALWLGTFGDGADLVKRGETVCDDQPFAVGSVVEGVKADVECDHFRLE